MVDMDFHEYYVEVGIGKPTQKMKVLIDTASDAVS